jgi:hypothetical protein
MEHAWRLVTTSVPTRDGLTALLQISVQSLFTAEVSKLRLSLHPSLDNL